MKASGKQIALIMAVSACVFSPATFAQSVDELARIETSVLGATHKNESNDTRLDRLEMKLFGAARSGNIATRLAAIAALVPDTASLSDFVPQAPQLDRLPVQAAPFRDNPQALADEKDSEALASALSLYASGRVPQAQSALSAILNRNPRNFDALYNMGVISETTGNTDQALYYYKRAREVNRNDSEVNKAVSALERKAAENQKVTAARAADQQSKLKAMVQEASVMYRAGNYDGAISKLSQVAAAAPRDADVQYALAQAYRARGDNNGARHYMAQASALSPSNQAYKNALDELNRAPQVAHAPVPSNVSTAAPPAPDGKITPFANSRADEFAATGGGANTSYLGPGSTRLKRAVTYGMAGAAGAALYSAFTPNYSGRSRGANMAGSALKGGLLGSFLGLTLGR